MEEWTNGYVKQPLNEMKNFKKEIENMPIVYFVNQTAPKIIEQAKKLSANEVEEFQVKKNVEYAKGEFLVKSYIERKNSLQDVLSEPIIVEGVCYILKFFPNGFYGGKGTHISLGIYRYLLKCLNLDTRNEVLVVKTMLHSSDRQKDFTSKDTCDWTGKDDVGYV